MSEPQRLLPNRGSSREGLAEHEAEILSISNRNDNVSSLSGMLAAPRGGVTQRTEAPHDAGRETFLRLQPDVCLDDADGGSVPAPGSVLQALNEASAAAVFSSSGRLLRSNAAYAALLGCRGHAPAAGARHPGADEVPWSALRLGKSQVVGYRARREDDQEIWLQGSFRPILDADGQLLEILEIATDISDDVHRNAEAHGQVAAINTCLAVISLAMDGTILEANPLFLSAMGYRLEEVAGRPYGMLVDPLDISEPEQAAFWAALARGEQQSGEYRRLGKDGKEVWLRTAYNPIPGPGGKLLKIVAYAKDITTEKLRQADFEWQIAAIHKSHAVITFAMDGLILDANPAFLEALGYSLEQVRGRHHRMFVEPSYAHSSEYASFWRELSKGHHQAGVYRRLDRSGDEVWLQATYNPVYDLNGRLVKVVKYASIVTEEKLRQADHQGQIAAIHKAQCVVAFSLDGIILDANDNFLDAVGYRLSEVRGRHDRMFVEPDQAAGAEYAAFWAALAAGKHKSAEFKRVGKDGREIWLQATYNPIFDLNGRPIRVVKYATDVTHERMRQADLEGQILAIRKSQGVMSFDMDGVILDANDRFLETIGYALDEIVGRHHRLLVDADYAGSDEYAAFWEMLRSGQFHSGLYRRVGKSGRGVWIQASYNPIFDLNGRPFKVMKFATDVTENVAMSEAYEDAKRQAQHDPATSLPNRVRLASFMTQALSSPDSRLVVFYLDLDRFKSINDQYGHQIGDRVLGEVADRLRRNLSLDQLAARVGGDEFVIVAPDLKDDEIETLAQRLIDAVTAPIRCEVGDLSVGASIGIAISPSDAMAPDDLLRCADTALYRSKQTGSGIFSFFAATLNSRARSYRSFVEDMQRGLAEDQFFLEYQPRFDTHNRHVRSVEALVRWNHPERGRISPAEFIPVAERSRLIVPLGEWVLRTACRAAAAWPSIGVSVNVSPVQFAACDLVELVTSVLEETGLEASRLELELTEGMLLEDAPRARSTLESLKRSGVRLAIDDFGTGYSSLSSLRTFPFDVIKIDRQFITDMESRDGGREVVQAILGLGKALGLSVTAEGVETSKQLDMLDADHCREVQGFLLARPMVADDVGSFLGQREGAPGAPPDRSASRLDAATGSPLEPCINDIP